MAEITINEAINDVRQMKDHFRSFAKLEEIIELVATSQQVLDEIERSKESLKKEMEAMRSTIRDYGKRINALKTSEIDVQKSLEETVTKINSQIADHLAVADQKIQEIDNRVKVAEEREMIFTQESHARKDLLDKAVAESERRLAEVKIKLEAIKVNF